MYCKISRKNSYLFILIHPYVISFTIAYRIIPPRGLWSLLLPFGFLYLPTPLVQLLGKEYYVGENKLTPTFPVYGRFVSRFLINEGSSERWRPSKRAAAAPEKRISGQPRSDWDLFFARSFHSITSLFFFPSPDLKNSAQDFVTPLLEINCREDRFIFIFRFFLPLVTL